MTARCSILAIAALLSATGLAVAQDAKPAQPETKPGPAPTQPQHDGVPEAPQALYDLPRPAFAQTRSPAPATIVAQP